MNDGAMDRVTISLLYREKLKELIVFSDEEWAIFAGCLRVRKLGRNEYFVEAGKVCRELGFIVRGAVRFCNIVDGEEVTGYFCFENNFVTALKSYITAEPCLYDIKTLEETIFVTISRRNMLALSQHPVLSCKVERFGRLNSRIARLIVANRWSRSQDQRSNCTSVRGTEQQMSTLPPAG